MPMMSPEQILAAAQRSTVKVPNGVVHRDGAWVHPYNGGLDRRDWIKAAFPVRVSADPESYGFTWVEHVGATVDDAWAAYVSFVDAMTGGT